MIAEGAIAADRSAPALRKILKRDRQTKQEPREDAIFL
jgi:hypothetical protein